MDEILKKIEEMKKQASRLLVNETHDRLDEIQNDISSGYITACDELTEFIQSKQISPTYEQLKYAHDQQNDIIKMLEKSNKELSERVVKAEGLVSQTTIKEKTNFDVITESPEKLYKFILDQYGYSQVKDGEHYLNLGWWLNQKAGE